MDNKTRIEIKEEMNALEKHVAEWINERAEDYEDGAQGVIEDLMHRGCQSGCVNHLIYQSDTHDFTLKYISDIEFLLLECFESWGESPVAHYDADQPLTNWLAWFAFEETAHRLASQNGIEI